MNSYNKIGWINGSEPPLSAENLNHMDDAIKTVVDAIIAMNNAGITPEDITTTITNTVKLSVGSNNELIKADSNGKFARSGSFVTNDQAKIIDNSTVEKFIPTARAVAKKVSNYVSNDDVFETLDNAFSGDSSNEPALLIDDTVDQTSNPDGNIILYYIDSDGVRHNLFNFSNEFYTISEVHELIDSLADFYALRSETAPTSTVGFDSNGIPVVILSATTFSAGACTNTSIKKLYVPNPVTRINGGAFTSCTALTDVYVDNTATGITVNSSAFPSGVTVHYHTNTGRMTFNAVDELIKAIHSFEEDLANAAY